jgi:hypothetical protein
MGVASVEASNIGVTERHDDSSSIAAAPPTTKAAIDRVRPAMLAAPPADACTILLPSPEMRTQ